ncbi:MAG: ABC transporter permease [Verrucomicrobia bacterium]|nr:ABC transporter permease [Verrucomicrobiota bacterium]
MNALPIVERELRVAARQPRTYRTRLFAAGVGLVIFGFAEFASARAGLGTSPGSQIFMMLAQLAFYYCLFSGIGQTCDCLSREKRDGTLGLLFLTDLKAYDIVLGKLMSSSLTSAYALMATLPMLAIPLLMGGVQVTQFWRTALSLGNTLFFSLSAGLLISSIFRNANRAGNAASMLILFAGIAIPGLAEWLRTSRAPETAAMLSLFSPAYSQSLALTLTTVPSSFWSSILAVHGLSWAFLALASAILPRAWQDKPEKQLRSKQKPDPADAAQKKGSRRTRSVSAYRTRLLKKNPFYWLAARKQYRAMGTWLLLLAILLVSLGIAWVFRATIEPTPTILLIAFALHLALKVQFAHAATERLAEDRENGTLEFLLSTPIRTSEIFTGQWLALRQHFLVPLLMVLSLCWFGRFFLQNSVSPIQIESTHLDLLFWTSSLMLVADMAALGWVGMWTGLTMRQARQAAGNAGFKILLVPWLLIATFLTTAGFAGWIDTNTFESFLTLWFVTGMATNFLFGFLSRRNLHRHFRTRAVERFQSEPKRPWWLGTNA